MEKTIKIDGNYLEGGGQILRTSLALSAITGKAFEIENIRAGRKSPGLAPQHLTAVRAMEKICSANVEGGQLHSLSLRFSPKSIQGGKYVFDISDVKESAGSVSLVFQTICLPLAFSGKDSQIVLRGGTHVNWSPCFEYLNEILLPLAAKFGYAAKMGIKNYGYYPIGKGEIDVEIKAIEKLEGIDISKRSKLENANLSTRGKLLSITGYSIVSNLPEQIAGRQKEAALKVLVGIDCEKKIEIKSAPSVGKGTILFLKANYENSIAGFFALGEIKKSAEEVGKEAALKLLEFDKSEKALDAHMGDQIMLFAALAHGKTTYTVEKVSNHLKTNAYTIKQFLPDVKIEIDEEKRLVEIEGAGWLGKK